MIKLSNVGLVLLGQDCLAYATADTEDKGQLENDPVGGLSFVASDSQVQVCD